MANKDQSIDPKAVRRGRTRIGSPSPATLARRTAYGKKRYQERKARENENPDERRARIAQRKAKIKERAEAIELGAGKPIRLVMTGGGKGAHLTLLHTPFADGDDANDEFSMVWKSRYAELLAHLGGEPTLPQRRIADHAARLSLIADVGWTAVKRDGVLNRKKQPTGAFEAYAKAARAEIEILKLVGLERRSKQVPTLAEIMAQGPSTIEQPPTPGEDGSDADANPEGDGSE